MQNPLTRVTNQAELPGRLSRLLIVGAVLVLSAWLASRAPSGRQAFLFMALVPATFGIFLILRHLPLGLLVVVAAGMVVPLSIGTGTGTSLNPVVLLVPAVVGLWLLDGVVRRKSIQLTHHKAVYLLIGLCAVAILALIVGQLPWFEIQGASVTAQIGGLMVFVLSAAAFIMAAQLLDELWLRRLIILFLSITAFILIIQSVPALSPLAQRIILPGALGSIFWTWSFVLATSLMLFDTTLSGKQRWVLGLLAAGLVAATLIGNPNWASGWAPIMVALAIMLWMRFPRWGWIIPLAGLVVFVVRFEVIFSSTTSYDSWLARRQAWQIVLETSRINPIIGLGPSNYYFYVQQADIAGWGGLWNVQFSSHNNYVDLIAQVGIVGLLLFLAFAWTMGRIGLRLFRETSNGFTRAYAAACVGGLAGTLTAGMLGDWFLPFTYNVGLEGMRASILFWIFLGGLLALKLKPSS